MMMAVVMILLQTVLEPVVVIQLLTALVLA